MEVPESSPAGRTAQSVRAVFLDPGVPWGGATSGVFAPLDAFVEMFGHEPDGAVFQKSFREVFGLPLSKEERPWHWTDYVLSTGMPGVFLEVRLKTPVQHGRRFGYVLDPALENAIREERLDGPQDGARWQGSLTQRARDALSGTLREVGAACGLVPAGAPGGPEQVSSPPSS